jgi:hypothetical protein
MPESWWLKFARAEQHMEEVKREARRYARKHPYDFIRVRQPNNQFDIRHQVTITEQPDARLALALGDFIHNLRSALDHVIVASVPKGELRSNFTSFPFARDDPWEKIGRRFKIRNPETRKNFDRALRGMDKRARAIVIANQPYRHKDPLRPPILGKINEFDNADKHRELLILGGGVKRLTAEVSVLGINQGIKRQSFARTEYAKDGTVIGLTLPDSWRGLLTPKASEVDVKYRGVATILVRIRAGGKGGYEEFALYPTLAYSRLVVRKLLLLLEPYAIYG